MKIFKMHHLRLIFIAVTMLLLCCTSIPVRAFGTGTPEPREKRTHQIPKITSKVRLDGNLQEPAWKKALVMELKYEVEPGENIPAPVRTKVYLAYGNTHLYVAFQAFEPTPSAIRSRYTDRDNFGGDDHVGIVLDTFNENRRFYRFYCNPYGVQQDYIETLDGTIDEWDGIWGSAGRINKEGYVVEMAIPFSTLRFQHSNDVQTWRFDAIRAYPRSAYHKLGLIPIDRNDMCYMCQADEIVGFKSAKPGKNIELNPTITGVITREREEYTAGKFVKKDSNLEPGITLKWGLGSNTTFNATVNPDFSNVEADVQQLDINTQFALYYPEKRPFFSEGGNYFYSPIQVIHTRALAEPDWGLKLTGKFGSSALGIFSVQDNITNLIIPGSRGSDSESLPMNTYGSAIRYRLDLGSSSMLGAVVTDREGDDYFNRLIGVDGEFKLSSKDRVWFQFLGSQTRYPDEIANDYREDTEDFSGTALHLFYRHSSRNLNFFVNFKQFSPGFRSDLGFVPQVGFRLLRANANYNWLRAPGSWFTRINLGSFFHQEWDYDGDLIYRTLNAWVDYNGPMQSHLNITGAFGKRSYAGKEFDYNRLILDLSFRPSKVFFLGLYVIRGDQIDYVNVRPGTKLTINPYMDFNPGKHLSLSLDHYYERLKVGDGRLYTANITNFNIIYQFNHRLFLRTIFQYVHYNYNVENYLSSRDSKYKSLFTQVLLSYKLNPRTVFFLGYSDDYYGNHIIPVTQTNHTLFLKLGYALRL